MLRKRYLALVAPSHRRHLASTANTMDRSQIINFGAGPSALPLNVLEEAAKGLLNYKGTGIGITEISHRSKEFQQLTVDLASHIRTLLDVPATHEILFTQGGGSGQFSAVVLNLVSRHILLNPDAKPEEIFIDYVITGSWSKKAYEEGKRMAPAIQQNIVADGRTKSKDGKSFDSIPSHDTWKLSPPQQTAFVYYCENETVDGVQFSDDPSSPASFPFSQFNDGLSPPIVADFSSSFLSRPIPHLDRYGLIYAGAQKNIGPAGLTILIVRKDLLVDVDGAQKLGAPAVPLTMSYKLLADHGSLYNTPPMFPMYVAFLVLDGVLASGGLLNLAEANRRKQEKLYDELYALESEGVIVVKVQPGSRSWMNVTFNFVLADLEKQFLEGADAKGFRAIKGHRFVNAINEMVCD